VNLNIAKVPALERGMRLLEWMALQEHPVTLTQIAQGLALGVAEVQRPVACLEEMGYLRRLPSGGYELSGRLFGLASLQPAVTRLRIAAEPVMVEFARQTGHSIHLSVPDGDAAMMILDVPGGGLVRISLRPGARFGIEDTVSGAMLAAAGAITTPPGWKAPPEIRRAVRSSQPLMKKSQQAAGIVDFGIVLMDSHARSVGVMTCSVVVPALGSISRQKLTTALKDAANTIMARF